MGFLAGKRLLITGVLSNRSIAYGIAQACRREGAELAFTYVGERFRDRIGEIAAQFGSDLIYDMDVGDDAQIAAAFDALKQRWDGLDGLVHSIGFAPREAIAGDFVEGLSRESFRIAHDISSYSFPALAKAALAADGRAQSVSADADLPRFHTRGRELQHDGTGQGEPRSERALPGSQPRSARHSRQWHFGRPDPNACRSGHQGVFEDPVGC